jgi:3-oxoacyl-[acyl-carrier-protein] synthase II
MSRVKRRVVVTGMGLVCPLGQTVDAVWSALLAGQSGIDTITKFDCSDFPSRIAGEVRDFDPTAWVERRDVKKMDTFIHYALAAARLSMDDSGLEIVPDNAERVGVLIGSGVGGFSLFERQFKTYLERGPRKISPFFIPGMIANLASGQVSIYHGAKGPNSAVSTACATGTHAIGDSFRLIQQGRADAMICGGSEAGITPMSLGGFSAMKALSTRNEEPEKASRPFDAERDGFVIAEGAGVLVLEEREQALSRGASIYAEIVGYGMSGDAFHVSAPSEDGDGPARVMRATLEDADLEPGQVEYINAHGTSTPAGDRIEVLAIKTVFGERASSLAISATKSMTGHMLGAAGGMETAVVALALKHGAIPPTTNLENPDPECDLDFVPNEARAFPLRCALTNSFGFGGTNASLALVRHEEGAG